MASEKEFRSKDQAINEDKQFLPDNTEKTPFFNDTQITIVKATLGALTNIAFVVEPYGAVLAGVLSLADGLLSLAYQSTDHTAEMARAFKQLSLDEKVSAGMKGLRDFCDWLDSNQSSLRGLERQQDISRKDLDPPDDSDDWLEKRVQSVLIEQTTPKGATLFTRMGLDVNNLEWDRPDIRLLCLSIDSYLFICYHMLVVVYARRARLALRANDTHKWAEMRRDVFEQIEEYRQSLDQKIKWWKDKLEALKQWRIDQVSKIDSFTAPPTPSEVPVPFFFDPPVFYEYIDSYTGKNDRVMDDKPGLETKRADYLKGLGVHIDKTLFGDWAIVNSWAPRLEETKKLLQPLKPAKAPSIQRWVAIPNINAALKGAAKVMYRYDLSSGPGATRSDKSDWTDELNLTEHDGKQPELLLSAENVPIELTMTVYRRIAKKLEGPFDDETVADVTTSSGSDKLWSDRDTEPAGR